MRLVCTFCQAFEARGEGTVIMSFVTPSIVWVGEVRDKPVALFTILLIRVLLLSKTSLLTPMCHIQYSGRTDNMTIVIF